MVGKKSKRDWLDLFLFSGFLCLGTFWFDQTIWLFIGGVFYLFGICFPKITRPVIKTFHRIMKVVGSIQTFILLSIVYFFVLTPVSLLYRFANRKSLAKEKSQGLITLSKQYSSVDFEKMW